MTRKQKDPLRELTEEERAWLEPISRSSSEPAAHVTRAKELLSVATGMSFTSAAKAAGRRSGDAVSELVGRFNREGLNAIPPGHGGGPQVTYGVAERERILSEARRRPEPEQDGTATWSLKTLQRALRTAPGGLPGVSMETVRLVLRGAGFTWQGSRSWCETGRVVRKRKSGRVTVVDPDATAKKS